ncbi:MAG: hypothetical protein DI538_25615, partial [Azospira oryzae]
MLVSTNIGARYRTAVGLLPKYQPTITRCRSANWQADELESLVGQKQNARSPVTPSQKLYVFAAQELPDQHVAHKNPLMESTTKSCCVNIITKGICLGPTPSLIKSLSQQPGDENVPRNIFLFALEIL